MIKRVRKEINPNLSQSQRSKPCLVCGVGGRTIGRMGNIELNYCPHHRKYGERVLNFLIRSVFGEELKKFLKESKDDLFMANNPELCSDCYQKLSTYTNKMIKELDIVSEWHNKMEGKKTTRK